MDQALVLPGQPAVEHGGVRALVLGELALDRLLEVGDLLLLQPQLSGQALTLLGEPLLDGFLGRQWSHGSTFRRSAGGEMAMDIAPAARAWPSGSRVTHGGLTPDAGKPWRGRGAKPCRTGRLDPHGIDAEARARTPARGAPHAAATPAAPPGLPGPDGPGRRPGGRAGRTPGGGHRRGRVGQEHAAGPGARPRERALGLVLLRRARSPARPWSPPTWPPGWASGSRASAPACSWTARRRSRWPSSATRSWPPSPTTSCSCWTTPTSWSTGRPARCSSCSCGTCPPPCTWPWPAGGPCRSPSRACAPPG